MEEKIELSEYQRYRVIKLLNDNSGYGSFLKYTILKSVIITVMVYYIYPILFKHSSEFYVQVLLILLSIALLAIMYYSNVLAIKKGTFRGYFPRILCNNKHVVATLIDRKTMKIEEIESSKDKLKYGSKFRVTYMLRGKEQVSTNIKKQSITKLRETEDRLLVIECGKLKFELAYSFLTNERKSNFLGLQDSET